MDVRYSGYHVFVDKNKREIIIFMYCSGGELRLVYVSTRNLMLRKKSIDLTIYDEIYQELKHIEPMAYNLWFK